MVLLEAGEVEAAVLALPELLQVILLRVAHPLLIKQGFLRAVGVISDPAVRMAVNPQLAPRTIVTQREQREQREPPALERLVLTERLLGMREVLVAQQETTTKVRAK